MTCLIVALLFLLKTISSDKNPNHWSYWGFVLATDLYLEKDFVIFVWSSEPGSTTNSAILLMIGISFCEPEEWIGIVSWVWIVPRFDTIDQRNFIPDADAALRI